MRLISESNFTQAIWKLFWVNDLGRRRDEWDGVKRSSLKE